MDTREEKIRFLKNRIDEIDSNSSDNFIATGFNAIDDIIDGFEKGNLSIWGKSPGMASRAMLNAILIKMALEKGIPTVVFTLNESRKDFLHELLYLLTGHRMFKINSYVRSPFDFNIPLYDAKLSNRDIANVEYALSRIEKAPLIIEQEIKFKYLSNLRSHIMSLVARKRIELVVIDNQILFLNGIFFGYF